MTFRPSSTVSPTYTTTGSSPFMNSASWERLQSWLLWPLLFAEGLFFLFLWSSSLPSAFRSTCRRLVGSLLVCAALVYGAVLMTTEILYAYGMRNLDYAALDAARNLYPYPRYIAQGPARAGFIQDLVRAVREDPRAFDLAAALKQLQLMEQTK